MKVERLDHYTIRTTPTDLERVRAFYVDVLGLHAGPRPAFRFDGHWLYADDRHPIVHLAVLDPEGGGPSGDALKTGMQKIGDQLTSDWAKKAGPDGTAVIESYKKM